MPISSLLKDTRGNVLMLTGLAILILFAVAGAGVDFGRQQLVRMKLQNASDAAAVAAASMPESSSAEQRRQVALRYYNLNYPTTYLGVARPTPNIQIGSEISVDASTAMNANFVSNVGVERLEAQGRTVVNRAQEQTSAYDVILAMDTSTSMGFETTAPNFAQLDRNEIGNARNLARLTCRTQIANFLDYFCSDSRLRAQVPMADLTIRAYGNRGTCRNSAPTDYCNTVSDDLTRYVRVGNRDEIIPGFGFTNNTRLNALRYVARDFVTRILDEGDATSRMGVVRWADTVVNSRPLTTDAAQIRTEITNMAAHSGTNPYLAMLQASVLARDFAPNHIKAVVLLTDGKPTQLDEVFIYPPNARQSDRHGCTGYTFCAPAVNQTLPICTQLKNDGVQVYTVGFLNPTDKEFVDEPGSYNRAVAFLRDCASVDGEGNPRYYTAENGAQLNEAFTQILTSLGRIRISQ